MGMGLETSLPTGGEESECRWNETEARRELEWKYMRYLCQLFVYEFIHYCHHLVVNLPTVATKVLKNEIPQTLGTTRSSYVAGVSSVHYSYLCDQIKLCQ